MAPVAYASTTLDNIIPDTTQYISADNSGFLSIVFRDTVADLVLGDLVQIPDTSLQYSFRLDSLALPTNTLVRRVTLGQLATQLVNSTDPQNQTTGQLLLDNHGQTLPFIPATNGLKTDPVAIDASQFFQSADITSGNLRLTIANQFPLDLKNVTVKIMNQTSGTVIITDVFPIIPQAASVTRIYDMAGKHIESSLSGQLANLDIDGAFFVPIDTTDYIELKMEALNLKASKATAVFPSQNIIDTIKTTTYSFGKDYSDVQLTKAILRSGRIEATASSTVQEPVQFIYKLLSANKNGQTPGVDLLLPAATPSNPSTQTQIFPLDGYELDLTQDPRSPYNTLREQTIAKTVASGKQVTITDADNVAVTFALLDIMPMYVEGYLGKQKVSYSGEEAIEVFKTVSIGKLNFANPKAAITFANSVGLDAQIKIKTFAGSNSQTGKKTTLTGTPLLAGAVQVLGPNLPDTFKVIENYLPFTAQNSNLRSFISLLPDKVSYNFEIEVNGNGQPNTFKDFATDKSLVRALLDIEIPLDGVAENIAFKDSVDTDFSTIKTSSFDKVSAAKLSLLVANGFPLQASGTAILYDADWKPLYTLASDAVLAAGEVNAEGRVVSPTQSVLSQEISGEDAQRVLQSSKHLVLTYRMDTKPDGKPVKFYADYALTAKLVAKATVEVGN